MGSLLFNFFALLTVICAVGVVVNKNAVNAAMCFLLSLVGVAGLFVLLDAYLLAFVLLLVYAGAVVALFLFIIMLLDVQAGGKAKLRGITAGAAAISAAVLALGVLTIVRAPQTETTLAEVEPVGASLKLYAYQLFTTYLLPVQLMGFLLLIAMLGVIVISKKIEAREDVK